MKEAGVTSDESANKLKPAIMKRKTVAQIFEAEKETKKQEHEKIVLHQVRLEELEQERLKVKKATTEKKTVTKKTTKAAEAVESVKVVEPVKTAEVEVKEAAKAAETKSATKATKTTKASKVAKTTSEKIILQVNGREDLAMANLIDRVKSAYVEEGNKADTIENIEVYIKLDENMAYYVIDGYASGISLY